MNPDPNNPQPISTPSQTPETPWPITWVLVLSFLTPASAYFVSLANLKRINNKAAYKTVAVWGGIAALFFTIITAFIKTNLVGPIFGGGLVYWIDRKYINPYLITSGVKPKFSAEIFVWMFAGFVVHMIITILMAIFVAKFFLKG